jgi:hypothetical protein
MSLRLNLNLNPGFKNDIDEIFSGLFGMPFPFNQMGGMGPMGPIHGLNANQSQPIDFNSMDGFGNINGQISNDQLIKLGIMPPMGGMGGMGKMGGMGGLAKTSADLKMEQMGGSGKSTEYINIANPHAQIDKSNFFF